VLVHRVSPFYKSFLLVKRMHDDVAPEACQEARRMVEFVNFSAAFLQKM
jgi:hypothetical protein